MSNISAAVIVKNEEENLPRLLKSIVGKFNEIVVLDTGSTDRTIEIAKEFGCKVYQKEWRGFADARNDVVMKCRGEWVWHFDADFELEEREFEKFKKFFPLIDRDLEVNAISIYVKNFSKEGVVGAISYQAFIHRNRPDVRWIGNIHEKLNVQSLQIPVYINHFGYQDAQIQKEKALRNLELIKKDLKLYKDKDESEYFVKLFYLFQTYSALASFDKEYLDDAKKYENEFLYYLDRFENKSSFFYLYAPYYYINLLLLQERYERAWGFLKEFEKSSDKLLPDILLLKYKIQKKLQLPDQQQTLIDYLVAVDEVTDNVVAAFVDSAELIPQIMEQLADEIGQEYKAIEAIWKKSRGKNIALLLAKIYKKYDEVKYEKFMKKITRLFQYELIDMEYANYLMEKKRYEEAKRYALKIICSNPYNKVANTILGQLAYLKKDYQTSSKYLLNVVLYSKDLSFLPQLIEVLKLAGFENEANKIVKRVKEAKK